MDQARKLTGQTRPTSTQDRHHWKFLSPDRRRAAVHHHLITVLGVGERFWQFVHPSRM